MKRILEMFRSARKIEFLIAVVIAALLVLILIDQGGFGSQANGPEARLERLLSRIDGAGKVSVMLSGAEDTLNGCVVVAGGADDVGVALKMQRAVMAATDLPLEKIEIIPSGG